METGLNLDHQVSYFYISHSSSQAERLVSPVSCPAPSSRGVHMRRRGWVQDYTPQVFLVFLSHVHMFSYYMSLTLPSTHTTMVYCSKSAMAVKQATAP